jgi:hypothetical protein
MKTVCTPIATTYDRYVQYTGPEPKDLAQDTQNQETKSLPPCLNKEHSSLGLQGLPVASPEINPATEMEQPPCQAPYTSDRSTHHVPKGRSPVDPKRANSPCSGNPQQVFQIPLKPSPSSLKENSAPLIKKLSPPQEPGISHPQPQRHINGAPALENTVEVGHLTAEVDPRDISNLRHVTGISIKGSDSALHQVTDRGGPHRVAKPRKKSRAAKNTQTPASGTANQASAPHSVSNVNRAMESLRIALLTDQLRAKHDLDHKDDEMKIVRKTLHDDAKVHKATILSLEAQQLESKANFARLAEKAKTNQRFVVGIQADYEKLQKSVTTFHADNKRVLQDKITEIEKEKKALHSEFESTTDSLRRSQRKMMTAVHEIYTELISTELKRKHLVQELEERTAAYEEKKKRCEELEKEVLASGQSIQRQFSENSTSVIEKLSQIQLQSKQVNDENGRVASAISQCLEELKELQSTSCSTAKGLEVFGSILERVSERYVFGLKLLGPVLIVATESSRYLGSVPRQPTAYVLPLKNSDPRFEISCKTSYRIHRNIRKPPWRTEEHLSRSNLSRNSWKLRVQGPKSWMRESIPCGKQKPISNRRSAIWNGS